MQTHQLNLKVVMLTITYSQYHHWDIDHTLFVVRFRISFPRAETLGF